MGKIADEAYRQKGNSSLLDYKIYLLEEVCSELNAANIQGDVAELGVYKGGSARLLATAFPDKKIYLFDSFVGMQYDDTITEGLHKKNEFSDTSLEAVKEYLSDKENCVFCQGWFPSTADFLTNQKFCLVHLDADYYESTKAGIEVFWNRLVDGGVMVFDDWEWDHCPGVKKAFDEFFTFEIKFTRIIQKHYCCVYKNKKNIQNTHVDLD
jgi:O-methyltransferase